jgi:ABC-type glycerol-3-phosphate transport system substrate-binding protein
MMLSATLFVVTACGSDADSTPAASDGATPIEVKVIYAADGQTDGVFLVSEGADELGCGEGVTVTVDGISPSTSRYQKLPTAIRASSVATPATVPSSSRSATMTPTVPPATGRSCVATERSGRWQERTDGSLRIH